MSRTIAIGDIHGCADALRTVLDAVSPSPDDLIITLGDYVDRGPDSRGVLDILLELKSQCRLVPLIGNHESMMLSARNSSDQLDFWRFCGGAQTLESYGGSLKNVPNEHWAFFDKCRMWYEDEDRFYVHANYAPELPLDEQAEEVLLWMHLSNNIPKPHINGKSAVVGHTPQPDRQIADWGHIMCIDTCCFGDGCLTACELPSKRLWQADKSGQLLQG